MDRVAGAQLDKEIADTMSMMIRPYSTNRIHFWWLLEMVALSYGWDHISFSVHNPTRKDETWRVTFEANDLTTGEYWEIEAEGPTLPLAFCRAIMLNDDLVHEEAQNARPD